MGWYQRAQAQEQPMLPFEEEWMQSPPHAAPPVEESQYETVDEELEDAPDSSLATLTAILDRRGLNYEIFNFENVPADVRGDPVIIFETGGTVKQWGRDQAEVKLLDTGSGWPSPIDICEWVGDLTETSLWGYVPETDRNAEFWSGVTAGYTVYHGTARERVPGIMRDGLQPRSESRGLTNRYDSAGVYTSADPDTPKWHYETVIEINVGAMKADGYMPSVRGESPVEEAEVRNLLAHLLGGDECGFQADSSDGLTEDTLVFEDVIPPKYLTVMD